jgi:hypothetical protein
LENYKSFESNLYTHNVLPFDEIALRLFHFQAHHNPVYATFLQHLRVDSTQIRQLPDIPFMPVSFFKQHVLKTGVWEPETLFTSSGTTGQQTSRHYVRDLAFYLQHARRCFEHFFGPLTQYHFMALLPSYLERNNSSLIAMMDYFIRESQSPESGFYLYEHDKLLKDIARIRKDGTRKIILWGVSFALLDLAERGPLDLSDCLIFETGGMKGRRKEITRQELHQVLKDRLNATQIHSEYGMTELFSQAYSHGERFATPPWMRILIHEIGDPFNRGLVGKTGGINIIDLANFSTIAFLETEDSGRILEDGTLEIMGRLDNSDVRGCNLLVE